MKEKIKKMKKSTKIIILLLVLFILVLIFNPFYWLMQAQERPKQPELSKEEVLFFKKIIQSCKCNVDRFYSFEFSSISDFENNELGKKENPPICYSLIIESENKNCINLDSLQNYQLANYIKNNFIKNFKYVKEINIFYHLITIKRNDEVISYNNYNFSYIIENHNLKINKN